MEPLQSLLSTHWEGLVAKLLETLLGPLVIAAAGLAGWALVLRHRENRWIAGPGVMLYVYFRNVDWRCERIWCALSQSGFGALDRDLLRLELIKLNADLSAMGRLASQWERRIGKPAFWYPYAGLTQDLLEAIEALQTALRRHTEPLLEILEQSQAIRLTQSLPEKAMYAPRPRFGVSAPTPVGSGQRYVRRPRRTESKARERNRGELKAYILYFVGERDRLWRTNRSSGEPSTLGLAEILNEQRAKALPDRLRDVLEPLETLLRRVGFKIADQRIWGDSDDQGKPRDYGVVWCQPAPLSDPESSASADRVLHPFRMGHFFHWPQVAIGFIWRRLKAPPQHSPVWSISKIE